MNSPKYEISSDRGFHFYKFISNGPKGEIEKGIQFSPVEPASFPVYNLALGDINKETGELDDTIRSDNKDRDMIFATVGATVLDFCSRNKGISIFAQGNTPAKQMVYRMEIARNIEAVRQQFVVFGQINEEWEVFEPNRKYTSLLVKPL